MKKIKGFLIMAGHLDIEWYQPLRSYRFWTVETLDRLLAAAKGGFPAYTLDGQVYPLEEYLEVSPDAEADMRRLIAEGRLAVGPFYTQFDEWLPSAENMIRNCLWGKKGAEHFVESFRKLLYSVKEKGFQKQHFIPVTEKMNLLNGAHRMIAALIFGQTVWIKKYTGFGEPFIVFGIEDLHKLDCTPGQIQLVADTYKKLTQTSQEEIL